MNKYILNIFIATLSSVFTFLIVTTFNSKDTQIVDLTTQITALSTRLNTMNETVVESIYTARSQPVYVDSNQNAGNNVPPIWLPETAENQSLQNVMGSTSVVPPPAFGDDQKPSPKMVMVNPTAEQNETYEVFKAKLEDPHFVSTLNISDLANSTELQTLPEMLRLSILSKAITKFNNGEVSKDVFMQIAP